MNYEDIILSITEEVINELLPANSYNVGKAIKRRETNLEKAEKEVNKSDAQHGKILGKKYYVGNAHSNAHYQMNQARKNAQEVLKNTGDLHQGLKAQGKAEKEEKKVKKLAGKMEKLNKAEEQNRKDHEGKSQAREEASSKLHRVMNLAKGHFDRKTTEKPYESPDSNAKGINGLKEKVKKAIKKAKQLSFLTKSGKISKEKEQKALPIYHRPTQGGQVAKKSDSDGSKEGPMAKAIPVDSRPAQSGQVDNRPAQGRKAIMLKKNTPKIIGKKSETKPETAPKENTVAPKKSTIGGQQDTRTAEQRAKDNEKIINNGKDPYDNYPWAKRLGIKREEFNRRYREQSQNIDNGIRKY